MFAGRIIFSWYCHSGSEEQLHCTVLVFWNCASLSASPEAWNHLHLGRLQLQHRQPLSKGEILWNGPIWDVSLASLLSSCMAGLQHRELFHGRRSPAPGSPPGLLPGAGSVHSVRGSTAHLLLLPFFPGTIPSSWASAGPPLWMEEVLKAYNKYYNLFAVGITWNASSAFYRQLEGEGFCMENLYKCCLLCQRIHFFLRSSDLKFLSTQIYGTLYLL